MHQQYRPAVYHTLVPYFSHIVTIMKKIMNSFYRVVFFLSFYEQDTLFDIYIQQVTNFPIVLHFKDVDKMCMYRIHRDVINLLLSIYLKEVYFFISIKISNPSPSQHLSSMKWNFSFSKLIQQGLVKHYAECCGSFRDRRHFSFSPMHLYYLRES